MQLGSVMPTLLQDLRRSVGHPTSPPWQRRVDAESGLVGAGRGISQPNTTRGPGLTAECDGTSPSVATSSLPLRAAARGWCGGGSMQPHDAPALLPSGVAASEGVLTPSTSPPASSSTEAACRIDPFAMPQPAIDTSFVLRCVRAARCGTVPSCARAQAAHHTQHPRLAHAPAGRGKSGADNRRIPSLCGTMIL